MKCSLKLHSLVLVLFICSGILDANDQSRKISVINNSWKFRLYDDPNSSKLSFDDSNWEIVTIPHTWNNYDGQDGGGNFYRGTGWYRKSFNLESISGKCIFLKFNSANLSTEVYVNGSPVGNHIGGYSAFIFNITKYVIQGSDNLIAVKVSNDASLKFAPLAGDFTFFGGITKSVELWVTGNVLISPLDYASPGVYITPLNISENYADIQFNVLLANYSNMSVTINENYTIKDAHNNTVNSLHVSNTLSSESDSTVSRNLSINNPVLWQGLKNPYLYTLEISLTVDGNEVDRLAQKFGVRYLGSNPDSGIYLNGKRYPLHGVAVHEDRNDKGRAISDKDRKEDMELLKETGLNFLRLAHYQHGQYTYNYCDSTGIVIWTEIPLLEKIDTSSSAFSDNIKGQLRELIKQNYNHPSVCFWGLFNEIETQTISPDALQVVTELNSLAKSLDKTRYTVAATNMDISSNSIPDLISWNLYFGWYYNNIPDFDKFIDNRHLYNPDMTIGVSEYGAGASIKDHEENPGKPIPDSYYHPEEYQNYFHEEHWKSIINRPFLWASSIWVGFDFASDARNEGDFKGINDKGLITRDRLVKKDAYFFYKANWSSSPVVHIASRRYTERTEAITTVKVYSNSDSVMLLVNNKSYGFLKSSDHIFVKNIVLSVGPNMIKALGLKNRLITRDSCIWNLNYTPDEIIKINFETTSTITPSGYKADKGAAYGDRGNGLTYGWDEDNSSNARERFLTPEKIFDTFIHLQTGGNEFSWEIAVKNGLYLVYVACGDPAYFDSHHKLMIENEIVLDGITDASSPWLTASDTVAVNDGKLTVCAASGGINTKINFIHITWIDSANIVCTPPTAPTAGNITQPTCFVSTGCVNLSNLPASGRWILTISPDGTTYTGAGSNYTVTGLHAGATYTFTVTDTSGCTSEASTNVVIISQPETPSAPTVETITQPIGNETKGSVVLASLPASGNWTLTSSPTGATTAGTGTSTMISGLTTGTYTYTAVNESGCVSASSANVVINAIPVITGQKTITVTEDSSKTVVVAHLAITDSDNIPGQMTIIVGNGNNYSVSGGSTIFPSLNFNGTLIVPVTVNDGYANSDVFNTSVTVIPVNDLPLITEIPHQEITQDSVFTTFNLDDFIEDVETPDDLITWTCSGFKNFEITIVDCIVSISVLNDDWTGSDTIIFVGRDNDAITPLSASDTVILTVKNKVNNGLHKDEPIHVIVYPNPAEEKIILLFNDQSIKVIQVGVFTSLGRLVSNLNTRIVNGRIDMDIHELESGAYFMRFVTPEFTRTFKIIKEQ